MNNCVGVGNLKFFLMFCAYTFLCCLLVASLLMSRIVSCSSYSVALCFDSSLSHISRDEYRAHPIKYSDQSAFSFVQMVLLLMECFVFGIFTLAMTLSQVSAVSNDETQLESWQKEREAHNARLRPKPKTPVAPAAAAGADPTALTAVVVQASLGGAGPVPIPVAQPLPPTKMTRARNCRNVFRGSASSATVAAHSAAGYGWFSMARFPKLASASALNPLACIARTLLFPPALLASIVTSGAHHYLLPTDVVHEDYARMCGYKMPAAGNVTRIDVMRQGAQTGGRAELAQTPASQHAIEMERAVQAGNQQHHQMQLQQLHHGDESDGFAPNPADHRRTV